MSRYDRDGGGSSLDCKLYVGDLSRDATDKDLERAFGYYGSLRSVWIARNPPGFAFVEFDDEKDADDAVRGLDGTTVCGSRVRVERSRGKSRRGGGGGGGGRGGYGGRGGGGGGRGFDPNDRCYECGEKGHYAYNCTEGGGGGGGRGRGRDRDGGRDGGGYRRRSRSYERRRSYSRSRSR